MRASTKRARFSGSVRFGCQTRSYKQIDRHTDATDASLFYIYKSISDVHDGGPSPKNSSLPADPGVVVVEPAPVRPQLRPHRQLLVPLELPHVGGEGAVAA